MLSIGVATSSPPPLIFSTPRYFGHIPLLAVPCVTRSVGSLLTAVQCEPSLVDAFPPPLTNSDSHCDVRIIRAVFFLLTFDFKFKRIHLALVYDERESA